MNALTERRQATGLNAFFFGLLFALGLSICIATTGCAGGGFFRAPERTYMHYEDVPPGVPVEATTDPKVGIVDDDKLTPEQKAKGTPVPPGPSPLERVVEFGKGLTEWLPPGVREIAQVVLAAAASGLAASPFFKKGRDNLATVGTAAAEGKPKTAVKALAAAALPMAVNSPPESHQRRARINAVKAAKKVA